MVQESNQNIIEINLSGNKLEKESNSLALIQEVGTKLFLENKDFIKEKVQDNWFVVVEPMSGLLLAGPDQLEVFELAKKKFPSRIFYSVGLLRNSI